mmetsp:Transcript_3027/g.5919  ORF Transcript_3027/g.5919 Transcript_3027/m.5919 type:complete len:215 (-) Transcript_3027:70-714(-)
MRFDWSPKEPSASISSASSSTKMRILAVGITRMLISVHTLPGVPMMTCSSICAPFSYRSSRKMHLTRTPASCTMYLPILSTSVAICCANSRVGQMHSACGVLSLDTTLSMPRTKHAVFPVPLCDCARRLRPAQIFGSDAAWILEGRTKCISLRPLSSGGGNSSRSSSKLDIVRAYSGSALSVLSITTSESCSRKPVRSADSSTSSCGAPASTAS